MSKINIGQANHKAVNIDLDVLLKTRLLIQANSGGGKSWLIRRLVEQAFGKIQIIIIDPEGEFPSLRERFDFVLVGQGGETPADVRSAKLVAHKLLELNASAVCDLFEMENKQRHLWVKTFLDAMIDAPKTLWHPVLVVVDEAHTFAPEKGEGESVASESMIGLASRGRKRGFCSIFATQRLAKMRKDATAEMLNRLVGPTFEEADLDRAAKLLSIIPGEKSAFFEEMKVLEPGNFYGLGRAISKKRIMIEIGEVQTTHPEVGSKKFTAAPPPAPAKIKSLLPKLSDLPKEAEQKIKTEQELRAEIVQLRRDLVARPEVKVPEPVRIEVPALSEADIKRIETVAGGLKEAAEKLSSAAKDLLLTTQLKLTQSKAWEKSPQTGKSSHLNIPVATIHALLPKVRQNGDGVGELSGPEQRILDAIAWFGSIGQQEPRQSGVAFLAGYTYGGGAFNNPRGALRSKGLVNYVSGDRISLTTEGQALANTPDAPLSVDAMQQHVASILPGPEKRILQPLIDAYPRSIGKDELAELSGYKKGGAFNNPLGRLRTLGLVEYPEAGRAVAMPILFLE